MSDPVRADFAMLAPKQVRYHEVDLQNIVFNANYLTYADIASTEYFRALKAANNDDRPGFAMFGDGEIVVRHSAIDFRGSARADEMLDLGARVSHFGRTSFTMEFAIFRSDDLLTIITTRYVYLAAPDLRPAPVPEDFRERVLNFEKVAPQS